MLIILGCLALPFHGQWSLLTSPLVRVPTVAVSAAAVFPRHSTDLTNCSSLNEPAFFKAQGNGTNTCYN